MMGNIKKAGQGQILFFIRMIDSNIKVLIGSPEPAQVSLRHHSWKQTEPLFAGPAGACLNKRPIIEARVPFGSKMPSQFLTNNTILSHHFALFFV